MYNVIGLVKMNLTSCWSCVFISISRISGIINFIPCSFLATSEYFVFGLRPLILKFPLSSVVVISVGYVVFLSGIASIIILGIEVWSRLVTYKAYNQK